MRKRRCYQNIGSFPQPRDFLSEVILPARIRDIKSPFCDSLPESCLGPGLRQVLHQLWDHRIPRAGYDCGDPHNYFCDILCAFSGLDHEFNKLDRFLSTRKRINAPSRDGKTSTISANDVIYLDFFAKSLLELILCLKHELTAQVTIGSGGCFSSMFQTNKLVNDLENKLYSLLGKLDELKIGSGSNICCKSCYELRTNIALPLRRRLKSPPWRKNNVSCPSDEGRCGEAEYLHYLPGNDHPISLNTSCRANNTRIKHKKTQESHFKLLTVNNTRNYNFSSYKLTNLPLDDGHRVKSGLTKSKSSNDSQNTFIGDNFHLNDCMVQERYSNGITYGNNESCCCVQDKCNVSNHNPPRHKINNMVHVSSRSAAQSQHNTFRRKRAGKDGSAVFNQSYHKPGSFSNNMSLNRETYIKSKSSEQESYNKIPQPKSKMKTWSKQVNFYSTSSDETTTTVDDVSDSSFFLETDFRNNQNKSRQNVNHSRKQRLNNTGRRYNFKNKKEKHKRGEKAQKYNQIKRNSDSDTFSSKEHTSDERYYTAKNSNAKNKSFNTSSKKPRKNKHYFQFNQPFSPPNRTNNKPLRRRRRKRINKSKINERQHNNSIVYASKPRRYKKPRLRSTKSNIGNFLTRVRSKLSGIKLFSSNPSRKGSKSGSSDKCNKSSTKKVYERYKRTPKRQGVESYPRHPSRYQFRPHTYRHKTHSFDSSEYNTYSSSSSLSQLTYDDDNRTRFYDERNGFSYDYPHFFERLPSSYENANDLNSTTLDSGCQPGPPASTLNSQRPCDVCPQHRSPSEECELADEYEIIFEKLEPKIKRDRPKKFVCKKTFKEIPLTPSTESSSSSVSVSLPEYKIINQPRKYVRRNRFRNVTVIKENMSPAEAEVLHRAKHRRRRKYIKVGSQIFLKSPEEVIDYEKVIPHATDKSTFSRGTSTEVFQPAEEKFTFHPPLTETYSRGTSTEFLPLYAKRTSTSDLIKLIQAVGTNTEQVLTTDTGVDPIPLKQKTPPVLPEVKSKFTNTDQINVRSAGTDAIPEKAKPPVVNRATDPLFHLDQKEKTTNTDPETKKQVIHAGTDPRPIQKPQQASKATDPLYYLGLQIKSTNTEPSVKRHAQTETPKPPANVTVGTTTTPIQFQDQKTSYDKVKTSSRGNNPTAVKVSDKGIQFDTVVYKPAVKTEFTETFTQPRVGRTTQTSFIETPKVKPMVYQVQTQTETIQLNTPPPILKQRKPSLSEEVAVVEAEEPSSPSELSMHLVFEKCQDEIYKRRTCVCKPRCSNYHNHGQRLVVCDNIKSKQMVLCTSSSDCNVTRNGFGDKSSNSKLEPTYRTKGLPTNLCISDHNTQKTGRVQRRKPKLGEECGIPDQNSAISTQNHKSIRDLCTESDEKSKNTIEATSIFDSSNTTFTSCDWKNIAEKVKLETDIP